MKGKCGGIEVHYFNQVSLKKSFFIYKTGKSENLHNLLQQCSLKLENLSKILLTS